MSVFVGVEGGASVTVAVAVSENGQILARAKADTSTNQFLVGMDKVVEIISGLVEELYKALSLDAPFAALGGALSGCDDPEIAKKMSELLLKKTNLVKNATFATDCVGSLLTGCEAGGMVVISGTGSACMLRNINGQMIRSGGWGHMIGDEGSGYYIASRAIRFIFRVMDGYSAPYDVSNLHSLMLQHFKIEKRADLLGKLYGSGFSKTEIASFAAVVAREAAAGDACALRVLHKAGTILGLMIKALLPKTDKELLDAEGGLRIVCVGSVFKSFDLFRDSLLEVLSSADCVAAGLKEFTLLVLTEASAIGAAVLGAQGAGLPLNVDRSQISKVLLHHKN